MSVFLFFLIEVSKFVLFPWNSGVIAYTVKFLTGSNLNQLIQSHDTFGVVRKIRLTWSMNKLISVLSSYDPQTLPFPEWLLRDQYKVSPRNASPFFPSFPSKSPTQMSFRHQVSLDSFRFDTTHHLKLFHIQEHDRFGIHSKNGPIRNKCPKPGEQRMSSFIRRFGYNSAWQDHVRWVGELRYSWMQVKGTSNKLITAQ